MNLDAGLLVLLLGLMCICIWKISSQFCLEHSDNISKTIATKVNEWHSILYWSGYDMKVNRLKMFDFLSWMLSGNYMRHSQWDNPCCFFAGFWTMTHTPPIIVGGKTVFKSKLVGIIHANIWLCSEYEERMEHVFMNQRYWLIILLSEALFTLCWVYGFEFYVCSSFVIVYLIPYTSCLKLGSKR